MDRLRVWLHIGFALTTAVVACKKKDTAQEAPPPADPKATTPADAAEAPPPPKPEEPTNTTDGAVTPARLNLDEHQWKPVPSLPAGAQMAVLEGEPPFGPGKGFAFLIKFPKNYKIPPHTHSVSERVTVLQGSLAFGHGEKFDKAKMKEIKQGGLVLIPAGHAHYVSTSADTVVQLQGVGPWGIYYIDPKNDPRKPAVAKPAEVVEHATDVEIQQVDLNAADIKWNPGLPSIPPGAEVAPLEGAPPFPVGKSFVFRIKMPDGYKIPVHHHPVTERVVVLSGSLMFGMGETWNDAELKEMKPGGIVYMPREHKHFVQAKGETIVQLQGVGPWGIVYANPDEDPRNAKK